MPTTVAEFLGRDHDRLHALLHGYQQVQATDHGRAMALFREFRQGLERHILWEEGLLFTRFEMETGMVKAGPTVVMRREHAEIRSLLAAIQQALDAGESSTAPLEAQLLSLLDVHNEKEEVILYPWIDRTLRVGELSKLVEQMQMQAAR